jgi:hypothetical protein
MVAVSSQFVWVDRRRDAVIARFGDRDANVEWPAAFVELARSVVCATTGNAHVAREQVSAT